MDRHLALRAAATTLMLALAGCGGGGGNPGTCAGSLEVCSQGRDPGDTVFTTNGTITIPTATSSTPDGTSPTATATPAAQ